MAYRTRYYPPLSIETNQLPANVVTEDKIAPGAVTGQQIEDGTVGADDIAANAVTSIKIAASAVTADKIADGVVGLTKLSFTPVSRPLTPPIATAEIADGAVTANKMAAAMIDTAQLVDSAVTTIKIAPASIDSTKLQVDSVTSSAIIAGAVGEDELSTDAVITVKIKDLNVTAAKLATDSVETLKIKDANVTLAKMAPDSVDTANILDDAITTQKILDKAVTNGKLALESLGFFNRDNPLFYDDFVGADFTSIWANSGNGAAAVSNTSRFDMDSGPAIANAHRVNWNGVLGVRMGSLPKFFSRIKLQDLTAVNVEIGLNVNGNEYAYIRYDSVVGPNWQAVTKNGGAETQTDTGIPAVSANVDLQIFYNAANEVEFYIGGALVATLTTNIPDLTDDSQPWIEVTTKENVAKEVNVDYVIIDYDRLA